MSKSKSKTIFTCQNCGAQRARWEGRCSDCSAWNSYVEEIQQPEAKTRGWSVASGNLNISASKPISLDQRPEELRLHRFDTGLSEFNRVLGGGLARGSFVLLGGSPGIGKSTLLLQMAGGLADKNQKVLYVSGEESLSQTSSRAHRLGIKSSNVQVAAESQLAVIIDMARNLKPDVVIIDSIQTVYLPDLQAAPGSVSQVRECAGHLMGLAKQDNISVLLVGHVTKDGSIAGPKVLEHMVDCVLSFEGDLSFNFRLLRSLKNRFGAANELAVFQMNSKGLEEVLNPSELFLQERGDVLIGSAVFASVEGTRPLLCEVQALTLSSPLPMPRRTSLGIDINRLHMLSAVLDRHLQVNLSNKDIFINVVGGLKLIEPAADVAVAAALISTAKNKQLESKSCFFGEVGLTGEIRGVSFADLRIKEADKLGFSHFILPWSNKKHMEEVNLSKNKKISYLKNVNDLLKII
ncbi:MAG: DNA repair protein RadA [Pseudobdellovibrionaceae bacterium]